MLTAFSKQCACGAMVLLNVMDQQIEECDHCEAMHVAALGVGRCPKCTTKVSDSIQFNVTPDPAEADVD